MIRFTTRYAETVQLQVAMQIYDCDQNTLETMIC